MGGRGATSYYYKLNGKAHIYGDEYGSTIHAMGNIKIVSMKTKGAIKAPQESQTAKRIYATIDKETGKLHSLSYMDSKGMRYKQVDAVNHKGMGPHAHDGYNHEGNARKLSRKEHRRLAMVRSYIRNHGGLA